MVVDHSFIDCARDPSVDPAVVLTIIKQLQSYVIGNLLYGEVLDVQYGMRQSSDMSDLDEEKIVYMLWLKTGVLYEFAGWAGALLGKNTADAADEQVTAIKIFTSNCGVAFQLQDDILGILGNEKALGKPIGPDIREGKKTVIVYESLKNAGAHDKKLLLAALGNKHASPEEIQVVIDLFQHLGGIARTQTLAEAYLHKALPYLDLLPESRYKELLRCWADFMINRTF